MKWYLQALRNYANFNGRARRTEYWMFALFNFIFSIAAFVLDLMLGTMVLLMALYSLFVLIPGLAVAVRRLHDTGKSGWMILVSLIPIIGGIWLLVLMLTDSMPGDNEYGSNPKEFGDPQE